MIIKKSVVNITFSSCISLFINKASSYTFFSGYIIEINTSNENNYRSAQLETLSKTIPLSIQAKAENTDMYNKTLDRSIETQAEYAINRNDIANRNLSSINDFYN